MLPLLNKYRPGRKNTASTKLNANAKPWNPSSRGSNTKSPSNRSSASTTAAMNEHELHHDSRTVLIPHARTFPQFNELNGELRQHIFSFVADAPLEYGRMSASSLTATLPFVCKEFWNWSVRDDYWEPALRRRLNDKSCGAIWKDGLRRLLPLEYEMPSADHPTDDIINIVKSHLHEQQRDLSFRELYKKVATTHIQFDAPIFIMPYPCQLGEVYGLHLFEPRYRVLVRDLMDHATSNPAQASNGGRILPATENGVLVPPLFIHAHRRSRLGPGQTAMLVQIIRCRVYEHGNADVQLVPVALVRLEQIRVRAAAGHLFYATASRLSGVGN